jgi:hypothetical protein
MSCLKENKKINTVCIPKNNDCANTDVRGLCQEFLALPDVSCRLVGRKLTNSDTLLKRNSNLLKMLLNLTY